MKLPAITFNQQALGNFNEAIQKEWLITNGLGGYASSTILGINTRKYHGLLVAALNPPGDRTVCLSKLDEDIYVGNEVFKLGSNEFNDTIYPQGYKLINHFSINPFPTYVYSVGGIELNKTIFMPKGKNAVSAVYRIINRSPTAAKLLVYPLLTCRYYHNVVNRWRHPQDIALKSNGKELQLTFKGQEATVTCQITEGEFKEKINWIDRLHYRDEEKRGESSSDDLVQPGAFEISIPSDAIKEFALTTVASRDSQQNSETLNAIGNSFNQINEANNLELQQLANSVSNFYQLHPQVPVTDWLSWILQAADAFVVENRLKRKSVIAGYHWFEPWGRDTFISLSGLLLVTGRYQDAEDILLNFIQHAKDGVIPNFITDKSGSPAHNTVDGTLWYINAVLQYLKYTGNFDFVKQNLWKDLKEILFYHEKGTLFNIKVDSDGLLSHGSRLTWMDAEVENDEVTPRRGKAVEIQALWYNALQTMERLASKFGEEDLAAKYANMAKAAHRSFNQKYWNSQLNCLFDVLEPHGVDASIRPNQILAASLDFTMLDNGKAKQVVDFVNSELVTPYGLRTLALDDPKFVGRCEGSRRSRDTSYHNGTIWPWLLGPFITAYVKTHGVEPETREFALQNFVLPLFTLTIHQAGLGTVSEIFNCDPPNEPRGCISQAWSVAEPLRAYVEDVLMVKPKYEKAVKI